MAECEKYSEDLVDNTAHPEGIWYNSEFQSFVSESLIEFAYEYFDEWAFQYAPMNVRKIVSGTVVIEWSGHDE